MKAVLFVLPNALFLTSEKAPEILAIIVLGEKFSTLERRNKYKEDRKNEEEVYCRQLEDEHNS